MPTLTVIGALLGVWVAIAALRGLVGAFSRGKPPAADLSRTRLAGQTTVTAPPPVTTPGGEDSVDY